MRSLYVQISFYKTYILEVITKGREIKISRVGVVNNGNNFFIGRLNKIDEYAEHLSIRLKLDFKRSIDNIILVLPNDFVIESLYDASNIESKNKMKEIKDLVYKNKHIGLNSLKIMRLGHNTFNDIYLSTEFDGKRMELLLKSLEKKGIYVKQILSPLNSVHHLARSVICPFEVLNNNNTSNVIKTGVLLVNATINRINYTLIHNNLPIECREGSSSFTKLIDYMSKYNVSFVKVIRLLNLIGLRGLNESEELFIGDSEFINTNSDDLVLSSLDALEEIENPAVEESTSDNYLFMDETNVKKSKNQVSLKDKGKELLNLEQQEDSDIHLSDAEYTKFEECLLDVLNNIRIEMQKTLNYFINNYGVKIANIIVVSPDVTDLDVKLTEYSNLKGNLFNLKSNETIEVDDFSLINNTDNEIDSKYSMLFGAILSNHQRGNIYE